MKRGGLNCSSPVPPPEKRLKPNRQFRIAHIDKLKAEDQKGDKLNMIPFKKRCFRISTIRILIVIIALTAGNAFGKPVTFTETYIYQVGDADSKLSCRAVSLQQAKRLLLEKLGTYIKSNTEIKEFQLTKDEIISISGGIVQTEILDEKWDGVQYKLTAKLTADTEQISESIDKIKGDTQKRHELLELKADIDMLLKEVDALKKELPKSNDDKQQKKYRQTIKKLTAANWLQDGESYVFNQNFAEAINAFEKSIDEDPTNVRAYYGIGFAYTAASNSDIQMLNKAIDYYRKGLRIDPGFTKIRDNLVAVIGSIGNIFAQKKNYKEAITHFTHAIEAGEGRSKAGPKKRSTSYYNRALAYTYTKDFQKAFADCNQAIKIRPEYADPYMQKARIYSQSDPNWRLNPDVKKHVMNAAALGNKDAQKFCNQNKLNWKHIQKLIAPAFAQQKNPDAARSVQEFLSSIAFPWQRIGEIIKTAIDGDTDAQKFLDGINVPWKNFS